MIECEKDPEGRSLFKTRGRHMVSKVLMQACRTFGIEQQYEKCVYKCSVLHQSTDEITAFVAALDWCS